MADIRSMLAKMDKTNGTEKPKKTTTKSNSVDIEKTYQKKSQLEHILLRPDTYIGSVEHVKEIMWIYSSEKECMVQKEIEYVPGLYKIFDEIIVNAADNKQRDKNMDCIKVEINQEENVISVWNNGEGIPVVMHKEENMYVPTMIFGHLLTSSNYNDEEEKVTGGRNGYGAKLCNIFSTKFTVETSSSEFKSKFKQTWGNNMTKASDPQIRDSFGDDYTKITFSPDLTKFKMDRLDDDIVGLLSRRAFDIAASSRGVKVFLNGKRVPVKNFKEYVELYTKTVDADGDAPPKVVYEAASERWEIAMTLSSHGFQQVSFVNSIATTKGGRHIDYVADMLVKNIQEILKKKNKGGVAIKPFQIKNHMWLFVNCLIVNPTFDSQTKENMTLQMKSFGSKCTLSEKFISTVIKSGIIESVLTWAKFKAQTDLNKKGGKKHTKLKGVPKLEDANEAGTKNAYKCTLILTEGDSAKSLAVSGLGVIGRDYYGVFPLRGKLLNVREATHKQILENAEINNLIKILGLQYKKKYNSPEDIMTLRYGKVMIMTDQDQDGSHIKGLIINFIHFNWPDLIKQNFLEIFITPIVKVTKGNQSYSFYSIPEFDEWKVSTPNHNTYKVKYYKGLGTSSAAEVKEYFTDMNRHRIKLVYKGQQDDDHILLAFSKKHIEHRKEWLTNFMEESKRRKEVGLPDKYLYAKNTTSVSYADFINLELVLFSNADNVRSIPCMVDGFKPGQRKILFTCIKRNDKNEVKVAQLSGSVAEKSAYHHGEISLCMTIVNMAQNFVGSNNINLLEPRGQFGTRLAGGKDAASARYIFTKMSPLTRLIFHPNDDPLLKYQYDDNLRIEPVWYIPIIPMVLVNGAEGIGTGWSTKIANYNPRELVANLREMIKGNEPNILFPWYKGFNGTIEDAGEDRYVVSGEIAVLNNYMAEITELPVGTWVQNYKENVLEVLLHGNEKDKKSMILDYKEYHTDTTVKFIVNIGAANYEAIDKAGFHKTFKLQSSISTGSMCVFDEMGCLRRMNSVQDILKEFFALRMKMYDKRKNYMVGMLEAEAERLSNQARFIMEKCSGELVVENKKRKTIVEELVRRGYKSDPVAEWKKREQMDEEKPEQNDEDDDQADDANAIVDGRMFDYLLGMSMWMLTDEKKNELLRQRDNKMDELERLRKKTPSDLWLADLDTFMQQLDIVEEKERQIAMKVPKGMKVAKGMKEKKAVGRKKINLEETMPSPAGKRIEPTIGEDIKKRIQYARNNKIKKEKKNIGDTTVEDDEFDDLVKDTKTLKERVGAKPAKTTKSKDGLKQTKLTFPKKSPPAKTNGNKRRGKKKGSGSENESVYGSDSEISFESPVRTTARRNAAKAIRYIDSDEDRFDDDVAVLHDNDAIKEPTHVQEKIHCVTDSEDESPPPKKFETSDDMFDVLVGNTPEKKTTPPKRKREEKLVDSDLEGDASKATKSSEFSSPAPKKQVKGRKKKIVSDDDDSPIIAKPKPKGRKKRSNEDSDDDFNIPTSKAKAKKKNKESDDDDFVLDDSDGTSPAFKPTARTAGRAKKPTNFVFEESDDDMSD